MLNITLYIYFIFLSLDYELSDLELSDLELYEES